MGGAEPGGDGCGRVREHRGRGRRGGRGAGGGLTPNGQVLVNDLRPVNYVDQMPPFDIVLSAQNELGLRMGMQIFGVELLNQGSGVSVDDVVIEAQIS